MWPSRLWQRQNQKAKPTTKRSISVRATDRRHTCRAFARLAATRSGARHATHSPFSISTRKGALRYEFVGWAGTRGTVSRDEFSGIAAKHATRFLGRAHAQWAINLERYPFIGHWDLLIGHSLTPRSHALAWERTGQPLCGECEWVSRRRASEHCVPTPERWERGNQSLSAFFNRGCRNFAANHPRIRGCDPINLHWSPLFAPPF